MSWPSCIGLTRGRVIPTDFNNTVIPLLSDILTLPVNVGFTRSAFVDTAVVTNAVVANCVVFAPAVAVAAKMFPQISTRPTKEASLLMRTFDAFIVPVNVGFARGALVAIALLTDVNDASNAPIDTLVAIALLTAANDASNAPIDTFVAIALLTAANDASNAPIDTLVAIALLTDVNDVSTTLAFAFELSAVCSVFTWLSLDCTFSDKSCRCISLVLLIS